MIFPRAVRFSGLSRQRTSFSCARRCEGAKSGRPISAESNILCRIRTSIACHRFCPEQTFKEEWTRQGQHPGSRKTEARPESQHCQHTVFLHKELRIKKLSFVSVRNQVALWQLPASTATETSPDGPVEDASTSHGVPQSLREKCTREYLFRTVLNAACCVIIYTHRFKTCQNVHNNAKSNFDCHCLLRKVTLAKRQLSLPALAAWLQQHLRQG